MDMDNSQMVESGRGPLLSKLPTELLMLIVALVEEKNDFLALCGTSTTLRAISLPFVFTTVRLLDRDPVREETRMKTLRDPQIAQFVTEFRVEIFPLGSCHPYHSGYSCSPCNSLDEILRDALLAMVKLECLLLECFLCPGTLWGRHTYIDKLPTRILRTFQFDCHCSGKSDADQQQAAAALPYLSTVRTLSYRHRIPRQGTAVQEDPDILPLVRNMKYHGSSQDNWVLATRPIERLQSLGGWHNEIAAGMNQSPGELTHLRIQLFLLRVLVQIPRRCSHLQHIGTFSAHDRADRISSQLSRCPPMRNVASIDVLTRVKSPLPWDEDACRKMKMVLPGLNKVILHNAVCAVWELHGDGWIMRRVGEFTAWDIIRGGCDDL